VHVQEAFQLKSNTLILIAQSLLQCLSAMAVQLPKVLTMYSETCFTSTLFLACSNCRRKGYHHESQQWFIVVFEGVGESPKNQPQEDMADKT